MANNITFDKINDLTGQKGVIGVNLGGSARIRDSLSVAKNINVSENLTARGTFGLYTGTTVNDLSTDGTLADNSDNSLVTEKAIKTYVDTLVTAEDLWDRDSGNGYTYLKNTTDSVGFGTSTPGHTLHIIQTATEGSSIYAERDLSSDSTNRPIAWFVQDNSGDDQEVLVLSQDGTGEGLAIDNNNVGNSIFVDHDISGDSASDVTACYIDFDRTVATSGTNAHNDIGIDLDVTSASLGTSTLKGMDIDVVGATSGTSVATGIDVTVGSADKNYAAVLNGGNVGIGTSTPIATLHISDTLAGSGANPSVKIETTSADSSTGPELWLERVSTTPADDDYVGMIRFYGTNSDTDDGAGTEAQHQYGYMYVQVTDITTTSEDSKMYFGTYKDGSAGTPFVIDKHNVGIGTTTPDANLTVSGAEGEDGIINLWADDGDDNVDKIRLRNQTGDLGIESYESGAWENIFRVDYAGRATGTSIKDQDDMSSNSQYHLATQQSIKAYVDTTQTCILSHNYYSTSTSANYIPFGGSQTESTSTSHTLTDDTIFIAPYDGKIKKLMLYNDYSSTQTPGNTDCKLRVNGSLGSAMNSGGAVSWAYQTATEYVCNQNNTFSKGDIIRVAIDPTAYPRYVAVTTSWEFDTTT